MSEKLVKEHSIFVGASVTKIDQGKKKEFTISFKDARPGFNSKISGDILLADLIADAMDFKVRVRGLTISWSEWKEEGTPDACRAALTTTQESTP